MLAQTYIHPEYIKFLRTWKMLRDFYEGEQRVKDEGVTYLPPTEGMHIDGMGVNDIGYKRYLAYLGRATFPEYVKEGVEALVGLLHQKDAVIELPESMEYIRERASVQGESLLALYRRITVEQILMGRLGLMADLPANPDPSNPKAYIAIYTAESILNWDADWQAKELKDRDIGLRMVILDESGPKRNGNFGWEEKDQYRILLLSEDGYIVGVVSEVTEEMDFSGFVSPMMRGVPFEGIPFVFVNSKDILSDVDTPPLNGLAQLCKTIYQGEADYRQNLYMQSQETLVVKGGVRNPDGAPGEDEAIRTGAGSRIDVDAMGDAKYIGVSANGLSEQRLAIENDRKRAEIKSGQIIQNNGSQMESGQALTTRFNAQSATLNQIAATSAAALESVLRHIAVLHNADPQEVQVTPNLEFIDFALDGQNFSQLVAARQQGLPLSLESLHEVLADRGLTKLDFTSEMERIKEENKKFKDILTPPVAPVAQPGTTGAVAGQTAPTTEKTQPSGGEE